MVAVVFGYLLATPLAFTSYAPLGLLLIVLCFPLLMRWHHPLVIIGWNASVVVFFLPGQPSLATVLACASLGISLLDRTMGKIQFMRVPETGWPLILIGIVALVTAGLTGGVGGRALGSEMWGAKRYLSVFGAIIGYFAVTARRIPPGRARCREGTDWLYKILRRIEHGEGQARDLDLLQSISANIGGKTLCAFGDAAVTPVVTTMKHFRHEYEAHIKEGRCTLPADWRARQPVGAH